MELIDIIIYTSIAIIGVVFGSFFTLAVYRIPRKENITYVRSHCTTCDHKLGFLDLIPVFSYLILGGKCRYCKSKIRIRYLLLELMSGLVFLLLALTRNIYIEFIDLVFYYLFVAGMFIIAGIDKEKLKIPNSLCIYELCIGIAYLIYKYCVSDFDLSNFLDNFFGVAIIPLLFTLINVLASKKSNKNDISPIGAGDIKFLVVIGLMFGFSFQLVAVMMSLIIELIIQVISKRKEIPWGFDISIASITLLIIMPYIGDYIDMIKVWG